MASRDWRPTAFVDTAPGAGDPAGPAASPDASLLALLRVLIAIDALAAIAVAMHALPRAATSVSLAAFLMSLSGSGVMHLRLLSRPAVTRDRRFAAVLFAFTFAGVSALVAGFWAGGAR